MAFENLTSVQDLMEVTDPVPIENFAAAAFIMLMNVNIKASEGTDLTENDIKGIRKVCASVPENTAMNATLGMLKFSAERAQNN